ncbi:MAG: hypothetical protein K1X66_05290 [Verrucomicrobiae bacterium]|nr:hypothetical protein [Verrucomicrobiae bacterium]
MIAKFEKLSSRQLNPSVGLGLDINQLTLDEIDKLSLSASLKEKLKAWATYGIKKKRTTLTDQQLALNYERIQTAIRNFKKAKLKHLRAKRKLALTQKQKTKNSFAKIEADQTKQEFEKNKQTLEKIQKENSSHLKLNREELHALVKATLQVEEPQAIQTNSPAPSQEISKTSQTESVKSLKSFTALPPSVQTVVASFLYNRREAIEKNGTPEEKNFWNATVKQNDWKEIAKILKATEYNLDHLKMRRIAEADYLIQNLLQKQPALTTAATPVQKTSEPQATSAKSEKAMHYWKKNLNLEIGKAILTECVHSHKIHI